MLMPGIHIHMTMICSVCRWILFGIMIIMIIVIIMKLCFNWIHHPISWSRSDTDFVTGIGVCGWILFGISWLLVFVTLPFSLCVLLKVRWRWPMASRAVARWCKSMKEQWSSDSADSYLAAQRVPVSISSTPISSLFWISRRIRKANCRNIFCAALHRGLPKGRFAHNHAWSSPAGGARSNHWISFQLSQN